MNRILLFFIILGMGVNANSQDWLDREMYPFESNYIDLEHGSMHYVDEGTGEVILFVHGTPTWSFLYRDLIKNLSASYRCIAIDQCTIKIDENPCLEKALYSACGYPCSDETYRKSLFSIRPSVRNSSTNKGICPSNR